MSDYRFKAFISYSHDDEPTARWLHRRLETYRLPKQFVAKHHLEIDRIGAIFRDRDELATSENLSASIRQALGESENLIVICTPHAARSTWVNEEIKLFKRIRSADHVFCLLAGDPEDSFPEAALVDVDRDGVATAEETEPLAADIRPEGDGKAIAAIKLIAGLMGVRFDELRRRELQRRHRRLVSITAVSLIGMAGAIFLATFAFLSQREAEHQRQIAVTEARTAQQVTDFLVDLFELSNPEAEAGRKLTAEEILARGSVRIERELSDLPVVRARLLSTMGEAYSKMFYLPEAKEHLDRALASQRELLDESDSDLRNTLIRRAWLAVEYEDHKLAEELYDEILPPLIDLATMEFPDDPVWVDVLNDYGVLQWSLGNYLLAIQLLEKSLEMGEGRYGLVHRDLVGILNNLALAKTSAGSGDDALTDYERSIEISEVLLGPNHPSLVTILLNMAVLVHSTGGDPRRAYGYQKRALPISIDAYGESNKATASVHYGLGVTNSYFIRDVENKTERQKYYQEAMFHLSKAQDVFEQNEGSRNWLAECFKFKARVNSSMGNHTTAVDLYRLAAETYLKPVSHPIFLSEWARALEASGDSSSAVLKWDRTMENLSAYDPQNFFWVNRMREQYDEFRARITNQLSKVESSDDQKIP